MPTLNKDVVKSVGRVFEVLELFDSVRVPMTVGEIARALKYPNSSTDALMKSMVTLGYASFDPFEFTYLPTMRLFLTSGWLRNIDNEDRDVLTVMDEIADLTHETVTLTCENDSAMQILRVVPGSCPVGKYHAGVRLPMFASIVGVTALSQRRNLEIVRIAQKMNQRPRALNANINIPDLLQRVRRVRTDGYGVEQYHIANHKVLAWAVPSRVQKFPYVISLSNQPEKIEPMKDQLVRTVSAIIAPIASRLAPAQGLQS